MTGSQPPGGFGPPPGGFPPPPPPPPPGSYPQPGGYPAQGGYPQQGGYGMPGSDYPVQVTFVQPATSSRLLAGLSIPFLLARSIMLIPAMFCLYFVVLAAGLVMWIALWGVLFTGHYPDGMYRFVSGALRWNTRASAYMYGLTDRYPPFRLDP